MSEEGEVFKLGDLTTKEYSFVIKCPASPHLPVRRKNSSALQGRWLEEPEGFPMHFHIRMANRRSIMGTVPNLGDLTTDEYSFVIKCPASRHLPVRRKTPPPCRGGGSKSRRDFPSTYHSAWQTKRPLWPPQGERKGRYDPVGVRPPPPLRGSSPCEAGQFIGRHYPAFQRNVAILLFKKAPFMVSKR